MHAISGWGWYLDGLNAVAMATAVIIFISTIDDLFLDSYYWFFETKRFLLREKNTSVEAKALRE